MYLFSETVKIIKTNEFVQSFHIKVRAPGMNSETIAITGSSWHDDYSQGATTRDTSTYNKIAQLEQIVVNNAQTLSPK